MDYLRKLQLYELEILKELDRIARLGDVKYCLTAGTLLGAVRHKGFIPWDDDIDVCIPASEMGKLLSAMEQYLDKERFFLQTIETDPEYPHIYWRLRMNGTRYLAYGREHLNMHHGIFIDIFIWTDCPKSKWGYKLFQWVMARLKSIVWAPVGAVFSKGAWLRGVYSLLSHRNGAKLARFIYRVCEGFKNGKYYSDLGSPFFEDIPPMPRDYFDNRVELMFEGHMFFAPKDWDYFLRLRYDDYMQLPPVEKRRGHSNFKSVEFDIL